MIDTIIKELEYIKDNGTNISISAEPEIREICSTADGTVYGVAHLDISIEYNDRTYIKNKYNLLDGWQEYKSFVDKYKQGE